MGRVARAVAQQRFLLSHGGGALVAPVKSQAVGRSGGICAQLLSFIGEESAGLRGSSPPYADQLRCKIECSTTLGAHAQARTAQSCPHHHAGGGRKTKLASSRAPAGTHREYVGTGVPSASIRSTQALSMLVSGTAAHSAIGHIGTTAYGAPTLCTDK